MTTKPRLDDPAAPNPTEAHEVELALVQSIVGGSEDAWHAFIERYSGLMIAVIHRYIPSRRNDEVRTLYADLLASLYRGKLATYAGRSALSTWLVLVTRNVVVDHLRHRLGGRDLRNVLRKLEPLERDVFHLYYVEGLSFGTVLGMLHGRGADVTADRLLAALQHIESEIRGRCARKLCYELYAQSVAGASGRLLEYLDHVQNEFRGADGAGNPEYEMMERETRRTIERIQIQIARLPASEQHLLSLRFDRGWSARRISDELGLGSQRTVYTVLDRILRVLRRVLTRAPGVAPESLPSARLEPPARGAPAPAALAEQGEGS